MSTIKDKKQNARLSDPLSASLSLSKERLLRASGTSRTQSLSPQKRQAKQPLHIRMNLTETQMDKITSAFTSRIDGSPSKQASRKNKYSLDSSTMDEIPYSNLTHGHLQANPHSTLAERRQGSTPAPIMTKAQRSSAVVTRHVGADQVSDHVSPLSPLEMYEAGQVNNQTGSSFYSSTNFPSVHPPPPPSNVRAGARSINPFQDTPLEMHRYKTSPNQQQLGSPIQFVRQDGTQNSGTLPSALWSPFPFYFRGDDFPSEKKGEKTMFGQDGWLDRTEQGAGKGKKSSPLKKMGLIDSIKKIAKEMATDFSQPSRKLNLDVKDLTNPHLTISLDAREQSLFGCELEYHLTNALNTYITSQLQKGRLSADKLAKINDAWTAQGRPRVVAFRYDLETQLDLVAAHTADFVFHGRRQGNPAEIMGLLHAMKVNARALRVRTFCQPDTVMAKWLVDSQSLFNLIGVGRMEDAALKEIAVVFRGCVDRERAARTREMEKGKSRESKMPSHAAHEASGAMGFF